MTPALIKLGLLMLVMLPLLAATFGKLAQGRAPIVPPFTIAGLGVGLWGTFGV